MNLTQKTRIAIAGIGGIGGYIGGKLAHYYSNNENIEIIFIARGEMAETIQKKGLWLESNETSYECIPNLTSDNPLEIGNIDVLIVCTKTFSVEEIFKKYHKNLATKAVVITTQNTVNGEKLITPFLPENGVLMEGSIYIASNIIEPGKIKHLSGPAKLFFGTDGIEDNRGDKIAKIFNDAGIDATFTHAIKPTLWKKFLFVSPVAVVTSVFKISFSEILENIEAKYLFINLTSELMQLAKAKSITIDDNTIINNLNLLKSFKGNVKSSLQLDLEKNKPTEINSLVEYIIEEAKLFQIPTPHFDSAIVELYSKYDNIYLKK